MVGDILTAGMIQGKIVKGVAGSYEVYTKAYGILVCKPKGIFRKDGIRPLPGDDVSVTVLSDAEKTGVIAEILPRRNVLARPAVANVDQALVIFAAAKPAPNFNLLDRFLVTMAHAQIKTAICLNKTDIADEELCAACRRIYEPTGCRLFLTSAQTGEGVGVVRAYLQGCTTTVAGPSGVGKSSLINCLQQTVHMETGAVSEKIGRGRHTTRHTQLIPIDAQTFILDTPGFGSLAAPDVEEEELKELFPEFLPYAPACRFLGCMHVKEPQCGVRQAVADGKISRERYENYERILAELHARKKY